MYSLATGRSCLFFLTLGVLCTGCFDSTGPAGSRGNNWLTCRSLDDCGSDEAVSCDRGGYCLDKDGERIAVTSFDDPSVDGGIEVRWRTIPADDAGRTMADVDAGRANAPEAGADASTPDPRPAASCAWGVNNILAEASVSVPDRINCGDHASFDFISGADCFFEALEAGQAAELTINHCIDCSIPTTYIATADGEYYAVLMEEDVFGDELREAKLERCGDLVRVDLDPGVEVVEDIICAPREELYQCSEPRSIPRAYKVGDPPADGAKTATLHLYVSNQSFDNPIVELAVFIEDTAIVRGHFDVEGQHNWILFDITVPVGTLRLRAVSYYAGEELVEEIEVPAERWAVLEYWYNHDGSAEDFSGEEFFTFSVHQGPVAFE